ncbi:hypothetical protein C8Q80DRAFT_881531 [Daedaleopsis nitida]|nr:hypothetical protein C8Q80DRAFT_881531 [Daedaleopsis nitida]
MPTFREILEAPTETEITEEDFQVLLPELPSLRDSWLEQRRTELESTVEVTCERDDVPLLSLAVATFECIQCFRQNLRWPQILAHGCARSYTVPSDEDNGKLWTAVTLMRDQPLKWPANTQFRRFSVNQSQLKRTCAAIETCGEDPNRAAYDEMETCGVRTVCASCVSSKPSCEAIDWKTGGSHDGVDLHDRPSWKKNTIAGHPPSFRCFDGEHTYQVKLLEAASLQQATAETLAAPFAIFGCTRCLQNLKSLGTITEHCTSKHDIDDPASGADYYLHADSPGGCPSQSGYIPGHGRCIRLLSPMSKRSAPSYLPPSSPHHEQAFHPPSSSSCLDSTV